MLYTCLTSAAARKEVKELKHYYVVPGRENDVVTPDGHDLDLYENGIMTEKGFELNYETKLRSREAYEWMARVSAEATHEDVVLVGEEEWAGKSHVTMLAEMMVSMFGGRMNFRYVGELK